MSISYALIHLMLFPKETEGRLSNLHRADSEVIPASDFIASLSIYLATYVIKSYCSSLEKLEIAFQTSSK